MINQRKIAFDVLSKVIYENTFLNEAINDILYENVDDIKIKNYVKNITSTAIENKILIDYIIKKYSKNKIDKKIYIILILAITEILFIDSIKSYATINEYVELSKKIKGKFLSNFVNAILRKIADNEQLDNIINDENIDIKIKYSIPKDLYKILKNNDFTDENIKNLFKYYNNSKHKFIRINVLNEKIVLDEFDKNNISYEKYNNDELKLKFINVYKISNLTNLTALENFNKGYFSVNDISSMYYIDKLYEIFKEEVLDKAFDEQIINIEDCCSSPGGKIISISHLIENENTKYYSFDINDKKVSKIRNNLNREYRSFNLNKNFIIDVLDATAYKKDFNQKFDLVIADVPCSNIGTIAKKPDVKLFFNENNLNSLHKIQYDILNNQKQYVKLNGLLSYSTCTITNDENKNTIEKFLSENDGFIKLFEKQIFSNENNNADGFYFAILKRIK